jgi:uncharacterized protein YcaQ
MTSITKKQARKLAVAASLNDGGKGNGKGKEAARRTIQHLGYVQIDTISVIERAHHHVFWSRQDEYKPEYLNDLLANDRAVFEQWAHAVAYMPIEDYRFYLPKIEASRTPPEGKIQKTRYDSAKPFFKSILKRIREEGPLASKDFEHVKRPRSEGWWEWEPAKVALDILYLQGDLMVSARRNFQRLYDLTERVLPSSVNTTRPTPAECAELQIRRTIQAMGLAREAEMAKHLQLADRRELKPMIHEMLASEELVEVCVAGLPDETYYSFPGTIKNLGKLRVSKQVRILSPFDNMIIQRERMKLLFDFDYTIECYVPAAKRVYGYFVCPILWGSDLVARIDMKADRKSKNFIVQSLHYESGLKDRQSFDEVLKKALKTFAVFNGCDRVK